MHGAIPPFPYTSSCRGVQLSTGYVFMTCYLFKYSTIFFTLTYFGGDLHTRTDGKVNGKAVPVL
jgi:hypothetical protein